jgi:hypothetical protein
MTVHLFLSGSQSRLGQVPEKITAFGEVATQKVQSAPARRRAGLYRTGFHFKGFYRGEIMKARSSRTALFSTLILLGLLMVACAPKYMINGRVVDAETEHPIEGAAVAIRWYENNTESDSMPRTIDVSQDFSDGEGNFSLPEHQSKNYVMGVYKEGYICWSSRSSFSNNINMISIPKIDTRAQNGMVVRMDRLKGEHSHDQHASFTVLVAEEVTTSKKSPFYEAIKPLFWRWRDNLREEFKKTFKDHRTPEPD